MITIVIINLLIYNIIGDKVKGLYIHIPFCKSICSYCDFTKRVSSNENYIRYIDRLLSEIDSYKENLFNVDTVYIGGGTPNVLPLNLLEKLFIKIKPYLDKSIENSIELNPELIDEDLCKLLSKYNFNRVSIGVESINDNSIKLLNRHHNRFDVINSVNYLRKNGIDNINIDMIFGIPNTCMNDLLDDLNFVLSLNPNHISYYSLIVEDNTILKYKIDNGLIKVLDDDLIADMYDYIKKELNKNNYKHYEISNFAKEGYESKHNRIYWNLDEYIGVGLGASGYLNGYRYDNTKNFKAYFKHFKENDEYLTIEDKKNEFMMLGLRLIDGVSSKRYYELFKSSIFDDFKVIDKLVNKGLLEINDDKIRIPYDKIFLANLVWSEFV